MTTKGTATKRAGSLTFPSDPLAAMRELSELDTPAPAAPETIAQEPDWQVPDQSDNGPDTKSYDNMTNKLPSKLSDNQTTKLADLQPDNKPDQKYDKPGRKKTDQLPRQSVSSPAGQTAANSSVAALIRQRAGKEAEKEVLKTVTLKISPTLDERIERYCFEHKIKKQDFWAEAAALYFEVIEQAEE